MILILVLYVVASFALSLGMEKARSIDLASERPSTTLKIAGVMLWTIWAVLTAALLWKAGS